MFRIRQINDDLLTVNKQAIAQVQEILKSHFSALPPEDIDSLPANLRNPFKQQFRSLLLVAERQAGKVAGFGLLMHDPELKFCFLDFIAAARDMTGRGIGGALYQRIRGEAARLAAEGVFNVEAVVPLWQQFQQGERKWHTHLWNVLMFQAWQAHWRDVRATVARG